jgi:hypothetical protein
MDNPVAPLGKGVVMGDNDESLAQIVTKGEE